MSNSNHGIYSKDPMRPIRNPYALKRKSSSTLQQQRDNGGGTSLDQFQFHQQKLPVHFSNPKLSVSASKEDPVANSLEISGAQAKETPTSSSTEYWQRLPSQNLTFGPAEILTVDECIAHASLYRGRSVRITGLLHQRAFQGKPTAVILELIHPQTKNNKNSKAIRKQIGKSAATPIRRLSQGIRPNSIHRRKRKSLCHENYQPPNPLNVILEASMPQLDTLGVGSMVMIIGTVLQNGSVQARIAQRVNNFDITFYSNSLIARRKFIYQRYQCTNQSSSPTPIQGCGPPPYSELPEKQEGEDVQANQR
jgi:hypothetical protein